MPEQEPQTSTTRELPRTLGLVDSILLVAGVVIGSGIFLTTGIMAADLPSPPLLLFVWAAGGALSLAGALAYAELGAMMPAAGGQYVYLREAYGDLAGFLFGWITLLVYQSGSIAAVSVGFSEYFGTFFPALGTGHLLLSIPFGARSWQLSAGQLVAAAAIAALTSINIFGVREGAWVGNILTSVKIGALAAFVIFGFLAVPGAGVSAAGALPAATLGATAALRGLGIAIIAVLWTYDGWNNLNFSAGEIKNPSRNIPLALLMGTGLVTVLYVAVNAAYLRALSIPEMTGVTRIAEKAAGALWGGQTAQLIAAAVMVSSFGCVNGMILTGARVYYAMARDGLFFARIGVVHPRFMTPSAALVAQGVWSILLTLSGTYEQLFTYAVFAGMLMYAASAISVFSLRRTRPDAPRPYRDFGYPALPALYIAGLCLIIGNTIYTRPIESVVGLAIIAAGLPAYWYFRKGRKAP
ncbi:MAG TPA: amino acid permease [Patescibacteria group bacterium]|nr:amino acid permease [Patescibacteria group bacterium]